MPEDTDDDLMRGMTVIRVTPAGLDVTDRGVGIGLPAGARVYSYTLTVRSTAAVIPAIGATLKLQDSQIDLPMNGFAVATLAADLPGLKWPAAAHLIGSPESTATLVLIYGHCKRHVP